MRRRLARSEVPVELTWNLDDIFPSVEAWEEELSATAADVGSVTKYKGRLGEGASVLLECLEAQEALQKRLSKVVTYPSLKLSTDGSDPANQAAAGRARSVAAKVQAELSFIRSEALALPEGTLLRYLGEEPGLASFRRTIERMVRDKPHMLHPDTEKSLAALGEVLGAPEMIYERSKSSDIKFDPVRNGKGEELPMSFALYEDSYERSPDTHLRRNAFASFTKGLRAYQNTYGATWGTEVKKNVVLARLRGYPSATHMLLHRQESSLDVYNNLLDIILGELAPHMRRYARLRKRVLGLDKLLYCDIEAPLDPEFDPETTYEEGAKVIEEGLAVLGPEYREIIHEGLHNRWIDRAENIGKATGAFCSGVYGIHPYILMTWTGTMRNALLLSHELGHGGAGVLAMGNQRYANARGMAFLGEAPSTINELLVGNHILAKSTDNRVRRWVLSQFLMTYHHNFVRHLIEGELQRRIYVLAEKGQPITSSVLSKVQGDILLDFWGDEVVVDEGARLTWMRQPHYYMGLYPYTYSAGLALGTAVAKAIGEEGQPAVDRWLQVLRAGGTKTPVELAVMAGVDMTKPDVIREAVAYVGSLVDEVVRSF